MNSNSVMVDGIDLAIAWYLRDRYHANVERRYDFAMFYSVVLERLYRRKNDSEKAEKAALDAVFFAELVDRDILPNMVSDAAESVARNFEGREYPYIVRRVVGQMPIVYSQPMSGIYERPSRPHASTIIRLPREEAIRKGEYLVVEEGGGFGQSSKLYQFMKPGTFCRIIQAGTPTDNAIVDVYVPV